MAFYNNGNNIYNSFRQEDGKVIGRIREGVKTASPGTGGKDYRFFVEPLSPLPPGYEAAARMGFTGFMSRIGYDCSRFDNEDDAWAALSAEWGGSLVVFTPAFRNGKYFVIDDAEREAQPLNFEENTRFVPVPVFSLEDSPAFEGDVNKFCSQLMEGKQLPGLSKKYWDRRLRPYFVAASFRHPEFDQEKRYAVFAPLQGDTFRNVMLIEGGICFEGAEKSNLGYAVEDFQSPDIASSIVICRGAPLCFVPVDLMPLLKRGLKPIPEDGCLVKDIARKGSVMTTVAKSAGGQVPQWMPPEPEETRSQPEWKQTKKQDVQSQPVPEKASSPSELESRFIGRFAAAAESRGLLYEKKDLINFHVSVKSSRLVILAGMSGTGKSGLVRLYAAALGIPKEQLLMIPVRPSWMDDSDILGYLDMKNMTYRAADTGLTELLIDASQHPDRMYVVCFDEMNLARAEHYFAQFISALEQEETPVIRLYNPAIAPRVYNSAAYPAEIPIGRNVIFTGTVNVDESTYHFSDKILDRANVITLHQGSFKALLHVKKGMPVSFDEIGAQTYGEFRAAPSQPILRPAELDFLDALGGALTEAGVSGIGYRVARQMGLYLDNIPAGTGFDREDGLDCQAVQRIFTKLRGSAEQLKTLLSIDEKEELAGQIPAVIDRYRQLSPFTEARAVLIRKAKELKLYDYTM